VWAAPGYAAAAGLLAALKKAAECVAAAGLPAALKKAAVRAAGWAVRGRCQAALVVKRGTKQ